MKITVIGNPEHPKIGDQTITSAVLFDDEEDTQVGTGAGVCTVISLEPPQDPLSQCLLTAVFDDQGQIMFGAVVPPPVIGAVGRFGILGGTDEFRTARGEVTLVVLDPDTQDATFDIDIDPERKHGTFTAP